MSNSQRPHGRQLTRLLRPWDFPGKSTGVGCHCLLLACGETEAMVMIPPPTLTQQYRLASIAARLSSTGISHHNLLPHIPSIRLSTVNSSPHPGIAHQPLNSSSQPLHLPGTCIPVLGMDGCNEDCLILIPFRLPQISCFTLSLKCFSSDPDSCPNVGSGPLLQFPHSTKGRSSLTNTPVFPPSFFILQSFV